MLRWLINKENNSEVLKRNHQVNNNYPFYLTVIASKMSSCISMTENIASGILLLQELLFLISVLEFVFGA